MAKNKQTGQIQRTSTGGAFIDLGDFNKIAGETFGSGGYLQLGENQADGPFTLEKIVHEAVSDQYDACDVFYAKRKDGSELRMPVQASFQFQAEEARMGKGDQFYVARNPDQVGKKGRAKGKVLQIYRIKVAKRVAKKALPLTPRTNDKKKK